MSEMSLGLASTPAGSQEIARKRYFFDVSITKLIVMSLVTLTFYQVFWFYQNWKLAKERGDDVIPLLRAIFGVLFAYELFKEVRSVGRSAGLTLASGAGGLALLYFVLQITWRLPSALWLLGYLTVLPLVVVQNDVAVLHRSLGLDPTINSRFTWKNVLAVVFGGILLLLIVVGAFLPEPSA